MRQTPQLSPCSLIFRAVIGFTLIRLVPLILELIATTDGFRSGIALWQAAMCRRGRRTIAPSKAAETLLPWMVYIITDFCCHWRVFNKVFVKPSHPPIRLSVVTDSGIHVPFPTADIEFRDDDTGPLCEQPMSKIVGDSVHTCCLRNAPSEWPLVVNIASLHGPR